MSWSIFAAGTPDECIAAVELTTWGGSSHAEWEMFAAAKNLVRVSLLAMTSKATNVRVQASGDESYLSVSVGKETP